NKADHLQDGIFDDEGGASSNKKLSVVSEEHLKNNKNALEDKK
ncbi:UNVERIFIED_CONTAM: YtxH domain-containing protein, partial [Escherichia coli]